MAHGKPSGFDTLYDSEGNEVKVWTSRDGNRALCVRDDELLSVARDIRAALPTQEDETATATGTMRNPWW